MNMRRLWVLTSKASIAVTLAALSWGTAYALDVGHARVVSAATEPLSISVQLRGVKDFSAVQAKLAPSAQWMAYGLTPPLALSDMNVQVDAQRSRLVVEATQSSNLKVVDLLLDVSSPSGLQRHQVSVLNASALAPIQLPGAERTVSTALQESSNKVAAGSITVKRGDTLSSIARENAPAGFSQYQYMAAIHALNPHAFTHNNINFIQSGATLTKPNLEQINQFSDKQARQFFVQQARWFEQYKAQLASGKAPKLAAQEANQGFASSTATVSEAVSAQGDRLELSQTKQSVTDSDKAEITTQAIQATAAQVSQLEQNLSDLNQALQGQGDAAKAASLDGAKDLGVDLAPSADSTATQLVETTAPTTKLSGVSKQLETNLKTKAGNTVSWIQEHMLMVMSLLLVFLVVLTVWILRRANANRDYSDSPAPVSSDMVREKLEKINLDLDVPPSDEDPKLK